MSSAIDLSIVDRVSRYADSCEWALWAEAQCVGRGDLEAAAGWADEAEVCAIVAFDLAACAAAS